MTYKTAWRMAKLIGEHIAAVDGNAPLGGAGEVVEVDETFVGGKTAGMDPRPLITVSLPALCGHSNWAQAMTGSCLEQTVILGAASCPENAL